jgi:tetratricopeptide (TPR) repeat protein
MLRSIAITAAVLALAASPVTAEPARIAKDQGPLSAACDQFHKQTETWSSCVGRADAAMGDDELFYAGYWLAKSGRYNAALTYLSLTRVKSDRVLTYMGYAMRKSGDIDAGLNLYAQALAINPDYVVARAYLGEAHLTRNEPDKAKAELAEIEKRCGASCAAYADLAQHIAAYAAAKS